MKPVTITYGSLLSSISIPSRKGFEFKCWKYEDEIIDINSYIFRESVTLTAEWNDIRVSANSLYLLEEEDSYTVLGINEEHTPNITIPNTYNGKPVTSISNEAFKNINDIESVLFGINIITIETDAFLGCDSLQIIYFEGNENDWHNNNNFTDQFLNVNIYYYSAEEPDSIGNYWFYDNDGITPTIWRDLAYRLENDEYVVTGIGNCKDDDVVIPEIYKGKKVTSIGNYAFSGCSGLTSIEIPNSVISIGEYAFRGCSGLTSIEIPNSVTGIGSSAFSGCISLTSITLPFVGSKAGVTSSDTYQYPFGYIFGTSKYDGGVETKQYYYGSNISSTTSSTYYIPSTLKKVIITGENILYGAFYKCSSLTSIVISDSVTNIGSSAFSGCSGITSIEIPNSVTSIGEYAFKDCSGITSIEIPNSVTSIGEYAFKDCSGIINIVIPNSVTGIGSSAFSGCSSLTSITLPFVGSKAGVTSSDTYQYPFGHIFGNCSYDGGIATEQFYYGSDSSGYISSTYYIPSTLKSVIITGGNILNDAFYNCSGLTSIEIPNSVTSIGSSSFSGCSGLTSIEIPSVTSIGSYSFYNCSGLTSIVIPNSVISIGDGAFRNCSNLISITLPFIGDKKENSIYSNFGYIFGAANASSNSTYIPKNLKEVIITKATTIGSSAFSGCSNLTNIEIPNSVTSIGEYAFSGCSGLTSIEIPDSVTRIDGNVFIGCTSLSSVIVDKNNTIYDSRNDCNAIIVTSSNRLLTGCLNTIIPNSVTSIGDKAFSGCSGLTSIEIPSVTSIGSYSFYNCSGLTSIVIPNSVISIGDGAFRNCSNLISITLPFIGDKKENSIYSNFGYIFGAANASSNSTYIPKNLKEVIITKATTIGSSAFSGCSNLTNIEIPNSVTSIGEYAFSGCSGLTNIVIPESVTSMGKYAFSECCVLESITIPFIGNKLENAEHSYLRYIFGYYDSDVPQSLKEVIITKETTIGEYAFSGCSGLTNIEIPNSVTSIGKHAFSECSGLTNIEIPNSVTSIGEYAFSKCSGLINIVIPESVTSIGGYAFKNCSGLVNIIIPVSVASIGTEIFSGCSNLISVEIPASVTSIGVRAYENCSALENITIPASVTSISGNAFTGCTSLSSVIVDKNNTVYDSRNDCNAIIETSSNQLLTGCLNTIIPASVTSIGSSAFSGCSGLTSIEIPESVTRIGAYAFSGCSSLTSIEIPNSVTYIFSNVFSGCNSLVSISLPFIGERLKNPSNTSFSYFFETVPTSLKNVEITNGTSIATSSFSGCSSLETIKIPNTITSIGNYAFRGCTSLTMLYYSSSKEEWDNITKADDIGLSSTTICYYSDVEPVDTDNLYWHYDSDGITPIIWNKDKKED